MPVCAVTYPCPPLHDVRIPGSIQQGRHPELKVQSSRNEYVGPPKLERKARLRSHEVGILVRIGDRAYGYFGSPDLLS